MTDQLEEIRFFMDPVVHKMEVSPAPALVATIAMATTPAEARIQVVVEMVGIRDYIAEVPTFDTTEILDFTGISYKNMGNIHQLIK